MLVIGILLAEFALGGAMSIPRWGNVFGTIGLIIQLVGLIISIGCLIWIIRQ